MDQKLYDFLFEKGNESQELFVKYMTKVLGHKFLAGDRNGKTINIELIEEITNSKYIPPNSLGYNHGSRLAFAKSKNPEGYTMPDELFLMKFGDSENNFYDVKRRKKDDLSVKFDKITHYSRIEYFSGVKTFLAVMIWNYDEQGFDIYVKQASELWNENHSRLSMRDTLYLDLSKFKKINKYSINTNKLLLKRTI